MKRTNSTPKLTVGLDLGDRYSHFTVLDEQGVLVESGKVRTARAAIMQKFAGMGRSRVVMEVGTHSPWASRAVSESGHEVVVANARKLRMIYQNESKSDRVDAESLARVGRMDARLLHPVQHRSEDAQRDLAVVRSRDKLVDVRTNLINHARGTAKAQGFRLRRCSAESFVKKVGAELPEELSAALAPVLATLEAINSQIKGYDRELEVLARERYPETGLLRQVAGVGLITALCYVLTLEDPGRFHHSRSVGAYLGLTPRRSDSGQREPQLRITKCGDVMLRRLMVQAAHYVMGPFGPDTDLRRFGERIAARGGKNAKRRAIVAVARKLACLLHVLWAGGEVYEPLRQAAIGEAVNA